MTKQVVNPDGMRRPKLTPHAVKKSGTPVFTSGQVGRDADGRVAEGGAEAQVEQIFRNLRLIVDAAGGAMGDVVKLTAYVTDPAAFAAVTAARETHFSAGDQPAATYVVVEALGAPELLVEIEAVALVD
jgi:2-iminobutanoate/2-iminopropanoate deaminase